MWWAEWKKTRQKYNQSKSKKLGGRLKPDPERDLYFMDRSLTFVPRALENNWIISNHDHICIYKKIPLAVAWKMDWRRANSGEETGWYSKQPLGRLTDTCLSPPELKDLNHHANKNEILNHIHELLKTKADNATARFWRRTEVNKCCMASVNKCRLGGHSRDKGFPGGTSD